MSDEIVIAVKDVSKAYRIWENPLSRLSSPLMIQAARFAPAPVAGWLRRRAASRYRDFWALRNVSFEVHRGESVGIIGRNGSGKSTLLQIIAGTLQPTSGSVTVNGRIAALLELGSGFNPEFTGRENVYLNASVLGMSREAIDKRFNDIAAFADIGDFIEQPVKTYSSGMLVRLAFAVQVQLEPEILIVDEALSVGDEPFQRKCFNQIAQMQQRGVAILFVSHGAATVMEVCRRVVLLDRGDQITTATPKTAIYYYNQLCYSPPEERERLRSELMSSHEEPTEVAPKPTVAPTPVRPEDHRAYLLESLRSTSQSEFPSRGARLQALRILDATGQPVNVLVKGDSYSLAMLVQVERPLTCVRFGWTVKTITGLVISGAATHVEGDGVPEIRAGAEFELRFHFRCLFNPGSYFIDVGLRASLEEPDMVIHGLSDALLFKVQPVPKTHRNGHIDTSAEPAWTCTPALG